jgi:hypothetical protein
MEIFLSRIALCLAYPFCTLSGGSFYSSVLYEESPFKSTNIAQEKKVVLEQSLLKG